MRGTDEQFSWDLVDERYASVHELRKVFSDLWVAEVVCCESGCAVGTAEEIDGVVETLDGVNCEDGCVGLNLQQLLLSRGELDDHCVGLLHDDIQTGVGFLECLDGAGHAACAAGLALRIAVNSCCRAELAALIDDCLQKVLLYKLVHEDEVWCVRAGATEGESCGDEFSSGGLDV